MENSTCGNIKSKLLEYYPSFTEKFGDNIVEFATSIIKGDSESIKKNAYINNIKYTINNTNINNIKPTEKTIDIEKTLGQLLANPINIENCFKYNIIIEDNKRIITIGNYIIDGHGLWTKMFILNPYLQTEIINFDNSNIIRELNDIRITMLNSKNNQKNNILDKNENVNIYNYILNNIREDVINVFSKYKKINTKEEIATYIMNNIILLQNYV